MQEVSFEEALELIRAKDPRYPGDAYLFVRQSLDYTQQTIARGDQDHVRHVTGRELLDGIRAFALEQFGPMTMTVLEEWGIHSTSDFGEIVFNMIEAPGCSSFSVGDFTNATEFVGKLSQQQDPISRFLWERFTEPARLEELTRTETNACEAQLAKELNHILRMGDFYHPERFRDVSLSAQARSLVSHSLHGAQLARMNRLLLEEAYPLEIAKSQGLLAKTEKDSRADFAGGYDFWEAFKKPFLPESKQTPPRREAKTAV